MHTPSLKQLDQIWDKHSDEWRDPLEIISLNQNASNVDSKLFQSFISGRWWETIEKLGITLFVTRESEHLVLAYCIRDGEPTISYYPLPHPSGMTFDKTTESLYIASTRNPNQLFRFKPFSNSMRRSDVMQNRVDSYLSTKPLIPVSSQFVPGCTYLHDLAMIGDNLHANAVGHNAVIRMEVDGSYQRRWWPKCIELNGRARFDQNYLQLNSIAAGNSLKESFFSASTDRVSSRRPGHKNFKVDKQGVIFSGKTRQPIVRGLTRPHSARIHHEKLWVDNSGYGELGYVDDGQYKKYVELPGWTRGLLLTDTVAFVGSSRVIPRFRMYAPGLNVDESVCGIHVIDLNKQKITGSVVWPFGNQVFSIVAVDTKITSGFPTRVGVKRSTLNEKALYYSFIT